MIEKQHLKKLIIKIIIWNKEVNKVVMECFCRSKPFDEEEKPVREYKKRIFREWGDRGTCL